MILSFTLSMPNNNSWNGKWSGEDRLYVRTINFGKTKKAEKHANEILQEGSFYYNFGDGWGASVAVAKVDAKEAAKLRKISAGFSGYDWMIESIKHYGEIMNTNQIKEYLKKQA